MATTTASPYLEIIPNMPPGTIFRADDVAWEEYEQLLEDLPDSSTVRIFYDWGKLEIMTLSSLHEIPKGVLHRIVQTICDELEIDLVSAGSTTIYEKMKAGGAEPDDCFYFGDITRVPQNRALDFKRDPPPDLAIEIDHTSGSLDKLPIYARFAIPEIWRVAKSGISIKVLTGNSYQDVPASRLFPFLAVETLADFFHQGLQHGERRMARAFREWLRENAPK